jgi:hypothetical protein
MSKGSTLLPLERRLLHCWVGSAVSASANGAGAYVMVVVVGEVGSMVAVSREMLRTIESRMKPSLLEVLHYWMNLKDAPKCATLQDYWP